MNNKIEEIRKRLAEATPGPWTSYEWRNGEGYAVYQHPVGYKTGITGWGSVLQSKENAEFIANAPSDIAYLLSEYDRMREALEWTKRKFEKAWTYEMGIGEVVDDIIRRFENAAEANRGL